MTTMPRMIAAEEKTAADVAAPADERAAAIARICTRAMGAKGIDEDLMYAVDCAIRAAVLQALASR